MFRTELPLPPHSHQLPLSARVLTVGSCFSDSIGSRLAANKVPTLVNPFGTIFNPLAACRLLRAAAGEDQDWQQHLVEARGRWQSLDLHSTIGAESPVDLLQQMQQLLRDTGVFVATADVVVLTLGSAWVYRYKETGELVSNCHKLPADKFEKELLTPDDLINAVAETHAYLRLHNPKLRFILTVSPVRHAKDTLPLNSVSKSVLRVACHYLSELLPDVFYFPAYELLLDDLRDYRFYAEDMLHPSKTAEDYIWEKFARMYFDAGFGRFRKEWESVRQALHHRPLYAAAPEHRQFLESTLERLERLASQADVRMELLEIRHQLQTLPVPVAKPEAALEDDGEERIDIGAYAAPGPDKRLPAASVEVEEEEIEEFEQFESIRNEAAQDDLAVEEDDDDFEATAETDNADVLDGLAPKKKRRSRGGAKRNKKKHAARLAAELAAQADTAAVTATDADGQPIASVQPGVPTPLPAAPAVSVLADPNMTPQTALERRKRNSRRARGRGQNDAQVPEQEEGVSAAEAASVELPVAATDAPQQPTPEVQPTTPPEATPQPTAEAPADVDAAGIDTVQRPARTGRSASEKRADTLRKPHRSGSRLKSLYATELGTGGQPNSTEDAAVVAAPAKSEPAIPITVGTGASGRLTESGKATRTTRAATPPPTIPVLPAQEAAIPVGEPAAAIPVPAAPKSPAPEVASAESEPTPSPLASAAKSKPRRAPRKAAPAAVAPAVVAPAVVALAAEEPAAPKPAPVRAPRKPKAAAKATPAAAAPVPATPPASAAKPVRKPAAKKEPAAAKVPASAKKAAPAKAEAVKKPSRPARPKKKPDTPAENE